MHVNDCGMNRMIRDTKHREMHETILCYVTRKDRQHCLEMSMEENKSEVEEEDEGKCKINVDVYSALS